MECVVELNKKDYNTKRIREVFSSLELENPKTLVRVRFKDYIDIIEFSDVFDGVLFHLSSYLTKTGDSMKIKLENTPDVVSLAYHGKNGTRKIKGRSGGVFSFYINFQDYIIIKAVEIGSESLIQSLFKSTPLFFPIEHNKVNMFWLNPNQCNDIRTVAGSVVASTFVQSQNIDVENTKVDVWIKTPKDVTGDWNYINSTVLGHVYHVRKIAKDIIRVSTEFNKKSFNQLLKNYSRDLDELNEIITSGNTITITPVDILPQVKRLNMFMRGTNILTVFGQSAIKNFGKFGLSHHDILKYYETGIMVGCNQDLLNIYESNPKKIRPATLRVNSKTTVHKEVINTTPETISLEEHKNSLIKKEENKTYAYPDVVTTEEDTFEDPNDNLVSKDVHLEPAKSNNNTKSDRAISHDAVDLVYDISGMIEHVENADKDTLSLAIRMVESLNIPSKKAYLIRLLMEYARDNK